MTVCLAGQQGAALDKDASAPVQSGFADGPGNKIPGTSLVLRHTGQASAPLFWSLGSTLCDGPIMHAKDGQVTPRPTIETELGCFA